MTITETIKDSYHKARILFTERVQDPINATIGGFFLDVSLDMNPFAGVQRYKAIRAEQREGRHQQYRNELEQAGVFDSLQRLEEAQTFGDFENMSSGAKLDYLLEDIHRQIARPELPIEGSFRVQYIGRPADLVYFDQYELAPRGGRSSVEDMLFSMTHMSDFLDDDSPDDLPPMGGPGASPAA